MFLTSISLVLAGICGFLVYRAFFHPLANIPGPPLARITKFWFVWQVRKGQCHLLFPALHKKYGPLVRITPDQVAICSEDVVKTAYSAGTSFTKGHWYRVTDSPNRSWRQGKDDQALDFLPELNMEKYKRQRRAIGPTYSISGMEKHEDLLNKYIDTYIARLKGFKGEKLDLATWMHIFALDGISHFTLSKSPDYTGKGHDDGNLAVSDSIWGAMTLLGLFPSLVKFFFGIPRAGMLFFLAGSLALGRPLPIMWSIMEYAAPAVQERLVGLEDVEVSEKHGASGEGEKRDWIGKNDLMGSLMKARKDKEESFPQQWVYGITMTNFGAGHETIMVTLSSAVYHLFNSPAILARLRSDLASANLGPNAPYTDLTSSIPLLPAILKESLRLWPAVAFFLLRIVPANGATICSTYLPPGTTIGANLWALSYDPELYPEPERFDPDRWMQDGTEAKRKAVHRLDGLHMGFGGQTRSCPGQNLARFFVIKVLVRLACEFDAQISGKPEFRGWFATVLEPCVGVRFLERGGEVGVKG